MKLRVGNYIKDNTGKVFKILSNPRYRYNIKIQLVKKPWIVIEIPRKQAKKLKLIPQIKAVLLYGGVK